MTPDAPRTVCECGTAVRYESLRVHRRSAKHKEAMERRPRMAVIEGLLRSAVPPEGIDGGIIYADPHISLSRAVAALAALAPLTTTPADSLDATLPLRAISGLVLHRAWLKSGRPDPLLDGDAWDGFALTVQAVAEIEGLTGKREDKE